MEECEGDRTCRAGIEGGPSIIPDSDNIPNCENPMSRLDPDVIECFIAWIRKVLIDAYEHINEEDYYWFDVNDIIILEQFILPVLEEHREQWLDWEELLKKGYGFVAVNIPNMLEHEQTLSKNTRSKLLKVGYEYFSERLSQYLEWIDWTYMFANQDGQIWSYVKQLQRLNSFRE